MFFWNDTYADVIGCMANNWTNIIFITFVAGKLNAARIIRNQYISDDAID